MNLCSFRTRRRVLSISHAIQRLLYPRPDIRGQVNPAGLFMPIGNL
jgi:hypothetical protein